MSEHEWNSVAARTRMARNLREILQLSESLADEATEHPNDREFPGGEAMNLLGPAASMAEWERIFDEIESGGGDTSYASLQEGQRHPRLVLGDWEERVRHERAQPSGLRMTLRRSADYLLGSLDWAITHFDGAPVMDRELSEVVSMLENVLHDGVRHDSSAAACFKDIGTPDHPDICGGKLVRRTLVRRDCEHAARAIDMAKGVSDPVTVLRQTLLAFPEDAKAHESCDQGGRDDVYRCRDCGGFFTEAEYWLCVKQHYERQAG